MGNRLAKMQLRIAWKEILKRFDSIEVVGDATRLKSNFVRGTTKLSVIPHKKLST
jgi:cytochrome P450